MLKIANPLNDQVFDFLMEDLESVKYLISSIIKLEPDKLKVIKDTSTENTVDYLKSYNFKITYNILKFNFNILKIKKLEIDQFMNFFRYNNDPIDQFYRLDTKHPLKICIYFTEMNLFEDDTPVVGCSTTWTGMMKKKKIEVYKEPFPYSDYIIQIPSLNGISKSLPEKAIRIFDQANVVTDDQLFIEIDSEFIESCKPIYDRLSCFYPESVK